ncbi:Mannose-specific lectin [Fusarium austroafricanum]|uniref:Mannose-specific lectin n=1 Tax=Fusarium austroafricanum TaxID=2364996 RepID=A0A8H4K1G1_9HYPO|nr:Mannose-specific lectin [Fusarium austroafricanum]
MGGDRLNNGDWLLVGQSLWSEDGTVECRMQDDGKIAVYHGDYCAWQSTAEQNWNTHGIRMQADGNLVIYDNSNTGNATWHTDIAAGKGNDKTYLIIQNDGNLVLYNDDDTPIWAAASNK